MTAALFDISSAATRNTLGKNLCNLPVPGIYDPYKLSFMNIYYCFRLKEQSLNMIPVLLVFIFMLNNVRVCLKKETFKGQRVVSVGKSAFFANPTTESDPVSYFAFYFCGKTP